MPSILIQDFTLYGIRYFILAFVFNVCFFLYLDSIQILSKIALLLQKILHWLNKDDISDVVSVHSLNTHGVRRVDSAVVLDTTYKVRHSLFVCTKCDKRKDATAPSACGKSLCSSLGVPGVSLDMEDMCTPGSPKAEKKNGKVTSGKRLYRSLVKQHHSVESSTQGLPLDIIPVDCLSRCDQSNVVAMSAPGKYTYQFGSVKEGDEQEILGFVKEWMESDRMGYTKSKERSKALKNILARIPPVKEVRVEEEEDIEEERSVVGMEEKMERVLTWQIG